MIIASRIHLWFFLNNFFSFIAVLTSTYGEITQKSEINLVWTRIQKPPQKKKAPLQVGLHNKYKQVSFISTGILVIRSSCE